jgi:uncharacterized RDD family membrane protein YckC
MYNCPKCKTPFEKGEKVCKNCGYNLVKNFILNPVCPMCGKLYPDGTRRCETDQTKLVSYQNLVVWCIRCGAPYPPEVIECPKDGGPIRPIIERRPDSRALQDYPKYGSYSPGGYYYYEKASISSRLGAGLLDTLFILLLCIPAYIVRLLAHINSNIALDGYSMPLLVIPFAYFVMKDGLGKGQSWGKMMCDLMVVDITTNKPCTKEKSTSRNLYLIFLPVLIIADFAMILFDKKGKKIGDLSQDTQVIETYQYYQSLLIERSLKKNEDGEKIN